MVEDQMTKTTAHDAKAQRLAAALRENLKRRKAQARGRMADILPGEPSQPAAPPIPSGPKHGQNRPQQDGRVPPDEMKD